MMEIADNQHPIDLSRKCGYYEQSQRYMKPNLSSSRPLPDLIPISSLLNDSAKSTRRETSRVSPFAAIANDYDPLGLQYKEWSTSRKELSRQRSMPHLTSASKMRKSNSDIGIRFLRTEANTPCSDQKNVPTYRHSTSHNASKYSDQERSSFHNSSYSMSNSRVDCRFSEDEVPSSIHGHSREYMKQGPGVRRSTIQSLRKMLDKRKSMQNDS